MKIKTLDSHWSWALLQHIPMLGLANFVYVSKNM